MSVFDWSKTAASNTTIEAIAAPVGAMAPSSVGPLFRAIVAAIKKWQEDMGGGVTTTGSADAYLLTLNSDAYTASATYADGQEISFVASFTNTGASTLNVNSDGAKAIRKIGPSGEEALDAGDITEAGHFKVQYDASANSAAGAWILLNPLSGAAGIPESILTTRGDLVRRGATGAERVALGSTGQVLRSDGTDAVWGAGVDSILTTRGDLIRRGASAGERVALGTSGQVLRSDGTDALWGWPLETWPVACSDETTAITATNGKAEFAFPYAFTVTAVYAFLTTPQATGSTFTIDIKESGTTILSTPITIDNTEDSSGTADVPAVISDGAIAANAPVRIDVTQIGDGTAKGLKVYFIGRRT